MVLYGEVLGPFYPIWGPFYSHSIVKKYEMLRKIICAYLNIRHDNYFLTFSTRQESS